MRALLLLIVLTSTLASAQPVAWNETDNRWLTSTSEHFHVHYLEPHQAMAERSLAIAEQVHQQLLPFFGQAPEARTHMVLVDDFDFSNGWATPLPFAQIRLFASPPQQVSSLEHNDDWLQSLIRHEYVHVLHMEMQSGSVEHARNVFGRVALWPLPPLSAFPHAFTPSMLLEGLAVYLETNAEQGFGRLQGSYYRMQMRSEVLAGELDDMNSVIVARREWPSNRAYLYGAYFIEFLIEEHGEAQVQSFLNRYSAQLLQYVLLDSAFRNSFHHSLDGLWQEFQPWLEQRFGAEIAALQQHSTASKRWSFASRNRQPMASDGQRLWYVEDNGEDRRQLVLRQGDQPPQPVASAKGVRALAYNEHGELAALRLISYASGRSWNDLFVLQQEHWQRLTDGQRLRDLAWDASQQRWLATRSIAGLSELVSIDRQGQLARLWQGQAGDVLGELAVSAAGVVVAAYKPRGQGWDLARYQEQQWVPLTQSLAVENSPAFLPDGRLVFSADYQGVFDLWALSLTDEALPLQRLTRGVSGAFEPLGWRGELVWQQYHAQGFQLHSAPLQELEAYRLDRWQGQYDYAWIDAKSYPSQDYSPWSTLRPRYWLPIWQFGNDESYLGLVSSGQDALARHSYSAQLRYNTSQEQAEWNLGYGFDNRWALNWMRQHQVDDVGIAELTRREDQFVLARYNLWPTLEDQWRWSLGLSHEYERWISAEGPVIFDRGGIRESLVGIATRFDNRESFINVPGVGWGSYVSLVAETNEALPSDYDGERYQLELRHTLDLPGRQTLTMAAIAAGADPLAQPFRIGGSELGAEQVLFGRDEFSLRGYDSNAALGRYLYRGQLRYQRWLGRVERNWNTWPLGLGDWYGNLFFEQGSAWSDGQSRPALASVGAELSAELILGYRLALPVTAGVAYGFNDERGGGAKVYLRSSLAF
jgi:hypothetical protein